MNDGRLIDAALFFVLFILLKEAWGAFRSPRTRVILRHLRIGDFVRAAPLLALVLVVAVSAITYVPYGDVGWWSLIGGQGNALLGQTQSHSDPSWIQRLAPWLFLALILFIAPSAVKLEERWFRRGADRRPPAAGFARQVAFGGAHLVVGVPLGAALALTVAGLVFQRAYLAKLGRTGSRFDALMASTRLHLSYNYLAFALVATSLIIAAQGGSSHG